MAKITLSTENHGRLTKFRQRRTKQHGFKPWQPGRRRFPRLSVLSASLCVLIVIWFGPDTPFTSPAHSVAATRVVSVPPRALTIIDGDTVRLRNQSIRLTEFDTPETDKVDCDAERILGLAATDRLKALIAGAISIRLTYEPLPDKYSRDLAEMIIDGKVISDILISEGLARSYRSSQRVSWC